LPGKRVFCVLILLIMLAGCALTGRVPQTALPSHLPAAANTGTVPFFKQKAYQCGPASMAMVLQWSGVAVTPDTLAPEVFIPERRGSLQTDLITAARRHGRLAYPVKGLTCLLEAIAAGYPVIVFQNLGLSWLPQWHYAVVTGYDLTVHQITMHTGPVAHRTTNLKTFMRTWERAEEWGLVVLPPDVMPRCAEEPQYLQAALGLQLGGRIPEATSAFKKAVDQWPDSAPAYMALGNALYLGGDLDGAVNAFRQATKLTPFNGDAFNNLAHVLAQQGQLDQAEPVARRAVEIGGPRVTVYMQTLEEIEKLKRGTP